METDEDGTRAHLNILHSESIEPRAAADGRRIVKTTRDGILVEFGSAVDAVRNALGVQRAMDEHNDDEDRKFNFRIGINFSDVIVEGLDIHGDGVNMASRLEGLCRPGEVYVSGSVFDPVSSTIDASFDDLGEQTVTNIARPVRMYRGRDNEAEFVELSITEMAYPGCSRPSIAVLPFTNISGDPGRSISPTACPKTS